MKSVEEAIKEDVRKIEEYCNTIYSSYKNNNLFKLLWDSRNTLLTYEFTRAGINFGDRSVYRFLEGVEQLYYHLHDDGGIRFNEEGLETFKKEKDRLLREKKLEFLVALEKPSWFTLKEKDPREGYLNGNGDSEANVFDTCIKYLKEDYFEFYNIEEMRCKEGYGDDVLPEDFLHIINTYLKNREGKSLR